MRANCFSTLKKVIFEGEALRIGFAPSPSRETFSPLEGMIDLSGAICLDGLTVNKTRCKRIMIIWY